MKKFTEELPPIGEKITLQLAGGHQAFAKYLGGDLIKVVDAGGEVVLNMKKDFDQETQDVLAWGLVCYAK